MLIFGSCWEWAGLVWEMFLDLVGVFCTYLEAPRSHLKKKRFFCYITPDIPPRRPDIINTVMASQALPGKPARQAWLETPPKHPCLSALLFIHCYP